MNSESATPGRRGYLLVHFLHHISESIDSPNIVATIAYDLDRVIDRTMEPPSANAADIKEGPDTGTGPLRTIEATTNGYLQEIDQDTLVELALSHDAIIRGACVRSDQGGTAVCLTHNLLKLFRSEWLPQAAESRREAQPSKPEFGKNHWSENDYPDELLERVLGTAEAGSARTTVHRSPVPIRRT